MTLKFHDVSHYQGNYHPDGPTIAKATEGTDFVDAQYTTNKSRTLAGGWPFAGYHFLTTADANAQAGHAHAVIGSTPAMLDVETGTSGNPSWAKVKAFITAYRKLGGVLHLAYIPKWYWRDQWGSPDMSWLDDNDVALISSQYTSYSDNGPGWDPYGGMKPAIWQYTATPIDTNAFKGTQDELGALFETGSTDVALTDADKQWILAAIAGNNDDAAHAVWHRDEIESADGQPAAVSAANALEVTRNTVLTLPTTTVPAGPLSDADVQRIAAAVVDLQAARLES
jgi:hypothetical protein